MRLLIFLVFSQYRLACKYGIIFSISIYNWMQNCVCVCVCVCVCLRSSTVKVSSVWIRWDTREQINDVTLKTLNSYTDSHYHYFGMQNLIFQLVALSWSHTRSGQSNDLTSVRLAFRTWDLHSPFSRRCLRYALHCESICFQTWHSGDGSQSI